MILIIQANTQRSAWLLSYIEIAKELQSPHHVVLGKDVLTAVGADMAHTQLPSWISPMPHNWGTAARGKLSADQWRIVGTIHLPIMLIWLWVNETAQKQDLLNSFMNLVSTVCIVNMCISSPNQSQAYKDHVFCYVGGLKTLYLPRPAPQTYLSCCSSHWQLFAVVCPSSLT